MIKCIKCGRKNFISASACYLCGRSLKTIDYYANDPTPSVNDVAGVIEAAISAISDSTGYSDPSPTSPDTSSDFSGFSDGDTSGGGASSDF